MKFIIANLSLLFAYTIAELSPSYSYLPPSPSAYGNGNPKTQHGQEFDAAPEVVAAKSSDVTSLYDSSQVHGTGTTFGLNNGKAIQNAKDALDKIHRNGDTRTSHHDHGNDGLLNHDQAERGYGQISGNVFGRPLLEDANEPVNYNFGYMVNDYQKGTDFGHHEERQAERAQGEYHVVLPDGRKQTVSYQADERGFKPKISYESTDDPARTDYDGNTNNLSDNGYHGTGNNEDSSQYGYDSIAGFGYGSGNNGDFAHNGNGRHGVVDHNNGSNGGFNHNSHERNGAIGYNGQEDHSHTRFEGY